jgi:flagella basal body P-ring formation protein FlgA
MIRIAALAFAVLVSAPLAGAQTVAKQVSGDWIKLGDVAPVSGEAAGILLGPAPPMGQTLSLDPAFIISTAKGAGVMLAIPLDKPVMVVRTGNATQAPAANMARVANPARQIAGEAMDGEVLVLVRDVPRGGVITDGDLGWQAANPARPVRNGVEPDVAVGMEARRLLKAGQPLQVADLKAAAVIRKGDPVTLIYVTPGVKLTVDGVAQNEAARGESVRVLNSYSKRTIEAVAHAPGEARVN